MKKTSTILIVVIVIVLLGLGAYFVFAPKVNPITKEINPKAYGIDCEKAGSCNNLVAIACKPELDGSFYYVNAESGEIIGRCGGYCMGGKCDLSKCPPKEWTCD